MEQVIDAIKKRAWGSLVSAVKTGAVSTGKNLFHLIKKGGMTLVVMYACGWAAGVGVYHGLSSSLSLRQWTGGQQFIAITVRPATIIKDLDHEEREPNE
ncbi:hypothetical protein [Vibrio fluvialis]|uniref:hypothetical protein n=1 Tax=Vibrio fluvialis TaxID=676 RepID=UPI0023A9CBC8|nr:hypothetical protein [Vibrio fluvialis]MDE5179928.1 hypothetical protein [Vibrio fluvialis]